MQFNHKVFFFGKMHYLPAKSVNSALLADWNSR